MSKNKTSAKVAIIMGSDSDYPIMKEAEAALNELNVSVQVDIVSAHRTPEKLASFATNAREQGITVIIAGAGGAAHLPGMVAAYTTLPVIGVPVPATLMNGLDSLYSIVQMPKGVPVATVAIGGAYNAGLLAAQIIASGTNEEARQLSELLQEFKDQMRDTVLAKRLKK